MTLIDDKLKQLAEDEPTLQAICSVFHKVIEKEKPISRDDESNELIGQKYRAYEEAKKMVEEALKDIENYKKRPTSEDNTDRSK